MIEAECSKCGKTYYITPNIRTCPWCANKQVEGIIWILLVFMIGLGITYWFYI